MELPGGAPGSYQDGQTNAETVVNITWGDDVQPVVDGTYALINKKQPKTVGQRQRLPHLIHLFHRQKVVAMACKSR